MALRGQLLINRDIDRERGFSTEFSNPVFGVLCDLEVARTDLDPICGFLTNLGENLACFAVLFVLLGLEIDVLVGFSHAIGLGRSTKRGSASDSLTPVSDMFRSPFGRNALTSQQSRPTCESEPHRD